VPGFLNERGSSVVKIIVVLILLVIVGSLGSALYYLFKDRERSPRTVKALTWRIGLSIGLFLLLLLAYGTGLIQPHGLRPGLGALGERLPSTTPAGQPAQPAPPR
jgi:hypothetical protein